VPTITGTFQDDTIVGTAGDDIIQMRSGEDDIDGAAGTDRVIFPGAYANYDIRTLAGVTWVNGKVPGLYEFTARLRNVEQLEFSDRLLVMSPASADAVIMGTLREDTLVGTGGNDVFDGRGWHDVIDGGPGLDTALFFHRRAEFTVVTAAGITRVFPSITAGEYAFSTVTLRNVERLRFYDQEIAVPTAGPVPISGATAYSYDSLVGTDGDDLFDGKGGSDTIDGGPGTDTAVFFGRQGQYSITTVAGVTRVVSFLAPEDVSAILRNVEVLQFSDSTRPLTTSSIVPITGTIDGNLLIGTAGDDLFQGNGGDDTILGGLGSDSAIVFQPASSYTISSIAGITRLSQRFETIILHGVETVQFTTGPVSLPTTSLTPFIGTVGSGAPIYGSVGDDVIDPQRGIRYIDGGEGNDTLALFTTSSNFSIVTLAGITYLSSNNELGNPYAIGTGLTVERVETVGFLDRTLQLPTATRTAIRGGTTSDPLVGTAGDDIFETNVVNLVQGGEGNDTIVYFAPRANYDIRTLSGVTRIAAFGHSARYSNNPVLEGVERILFTDAEVTLQPTSRPLIRSVSGVLDRIGTGGDDLFLGSGFGRFDGGAGRDTVLRFENSTGYRVETIAGITRIIRSENYPFGNFSIYSNVEEVQFLDRTIALDAPAVTLLTAPFGSIRINGTTGSDLFLPTSFVTLFGGAGLDTAVVFADSKDFTFERTATGVAMTGTPGTSYLSFTTVAMESVERVRFLDRELVLQTYANDLFLLRTVNGLVGWSQPDGAGGFTSFGAPAGLDLASLTVRGIGDFDGDGRGDLLLGRPGGPDLVWALTGGPSALSAVAGYSGQRVAASGDFIGSTATDILLTDGAGAFSFVDVAAGTTRPFLTLAPGFALVGVGNLDGTGKDDVLFQNTATGALLYWNGEAFRNSLTLAPASGWQVERIGNFVGSATDDILLFNTKSRVLLFWDATRGTAGFQDFITLPENYLVAGAADFDGDGRDDVLFRSNDGASSVYWSGTGFVDVGGVLASATLVGVGDFG